MIAALIGRRWGVALATALALAAGVQTWRVSRLQDDLAARERLLGVMEAGRAAAEAALRARDAALAEKAQIDRRDVAELADAMKGTCRAAFDAGYATRRCSASELAGVRDLTQLWRDGAFPGSAADVPGEPPG